MSPCLLVLKLKAGLILALSVFLFKKTLPSSEVYANFLFLLEFTLVVLILFYLFVKPVEAVEIFFEWVFKGFGVRNFPAAEFALEVGDARPGMRFAGRNSGIEILRSKISGRDAEKVVFCDGGVRS